MTLCTCMHSASHHLLFSIHIYIYTIIIYPYTISSHLGIKGCIVLRATYTSAHNNNNSNNNNITIILGTEKCTKVL